MQNESNPQWDPMDQPDTDPNQRKRRVHLEKVKARHTSHWDWDYLPQAELEKLLRSSSSANRNGPADGSNQLQKSSRVAALIGMALGLIAIAAGIYYLTL